MAYKKEDEDFRYIIRNGAKDIEVVMKRVTEVHHLPYRKIELAELGALPSLKPRSAPSKFDPEKSSDDEDKDTFISPRIRKRPGYLP